MEGPHRQLRSRFADRLCSDDANGFAEIDHMPSPKIATIAHDANAPPRCTGQHRADLDALQARIFDALNQFLVDFLLALMLTWPVKGSLTSSRAARPTTRSPNGSVSS